MRARMAVWIASALTLTAIALTTSTAQADPNDSQRLRGLGGRSFIVQVVVTASVVGPFPVGAEFENCYSFNADGTFADEKYSLLFGPVAAGNWAQDSNGAETAYSASVAGAGGALLVQNGIVTPAHGSGVLQLSAQSEVLVGATQLIAVTASGHQAPSCAS